MMVSQVHLWDCFLSILPPVFALVKTISLIRFRGFARSRGLARLKGVSTHEYIVHLCLCVLFFFITASQLVVSSVGQEWTERQALAFHILLGLCMIFPSIFEYLPSRVWLYSQTKERYYFIFVVASSLIKSVFLVLGVKHVLPFESLTVSWVIDYVVLSYYTHYELPYAQPLRYRRAVDYGVIAIVATVFTILGFIYASTWVNLNQVLLIVTTGWVIHAQPPMDESLHDRVPLTEVPRSEGTSDGDVDRTPTSSSEQHLDPTCTA